MIGFIIGFVLGSWFGFGFAAVFVMAGDDRDDEWNGDMEGEEDEESCGYDATYL